MTTVKIEPPTRGLVIEAINKIREKERELAALHTRERAMSRALYDSEVERLKGRIEELTLRIADMVPE